MQKEHSVKVVIIMTTVYLAFQSLSTVTSGNPGSSTHVSIFDLQYSILYAQFFVFLFVCMYISRIDRIH